MTRFSVVVGVAVLAVACGRQNSEAGRTAASGNRSNEQAIPSTSVNQPGTNPGLSTTPEQLVKVTGCLNGAEEPVGTAGASARPPVATRKSADEAQALRGESASANRFMLTHATPASEDARGVGNNGAGGSGGPLVNGVSEYALEGNAAELSLHVNHQVIVTARINPKQTLTEAPRTDVNGGIQSNGATSRGTAGSGASSMSGAQASAGGVQAAPTEANGGPVRTLVVESIQTVSPTCK